MDIEDYLGSLVGVEIPRKDTIGLKFMYIRSNIEDHLLEKDEPRQKHLTTIHENEDHYTIISLW